MPSAPKIQKDTMLSVALQMVVDEGYQSVTIKTLAAKLGCSTAPISWQFGGMEGFRQELYDYACHYAEKKYYYNNGSQLATFEQNGFGTVDMALYEPNLFRFLYLSEKIVGVWDGIFEVPGGAYGKQACQGLAQALGLTEKQAADFMVAMMLYAQGIAVTLVCGNMHPDKQRVYAMIHQTGMVYLKGLGITSEQLAKMFCP